MINLKLALQKDIEEGIRQAAAAGAFVLPEELTVVVERPEDTARGDYASPMALVLARQRKSKETPSSSPLSKGEKTPMEIVEAVAAHMPKKEYIEKMEAAPPGFLNIWIDPKWLAAKLDDVLDQDIFLDLNVGQSRSVNLEFISANPTGPLTLGNARTAFTADTLGNVLEATGYNVTREYYVNDAGGQIRRLGESVLRRILLDNGIEVEFPEDLYQGEYISSIGVMIAERWRENEGKEFSAKDLEDEALLQRVSEEAVDLCLSLIKGSITDDLRISFDVWTSERKIRESGVIERALERLRERGYTYTKEGAEYFKSSQFGDTEDRVLVKKDGEYAYLAPDIGYHQDKYERKFDVICTFLGADHQGYIPRLKAAMEALGNDVDKLHFEVAQWMALVKDGETFKPSKRKGYTYGPGELIGEIGYDAARFFLVQHSLSSHMELDLDLAKDRSERNPVYYVQYAFVRLQSILRKAKEQGVVENVGERIALEEVSGLEHAAEVRLMKEMYRLPEVATGIADSFEVHRLPFFAHDLARAVHGFYNEVHVLGEEDEQIQKSRLQLVVAARKVLGATLDLLGVGKPDVM